MYWHYNSMYRRVSTYLHLLSVLAVMLYGTTTVSAYEVPQAKLELTSNGFTVSIPDELDNGIKKVFYVLEVNSACSPLIEIVTEPTNKRWQYTTTAMQLKSTDQLSMAIMVQHEDDVYVAMQCLHVDNVSLPNIYTFERCESQELADPEQASILTSNCERAQTTEVYNKLPPCANEMIFRDEFNANEVNTTQWTIEDPLMRGDRSIDYEFVMYDKEMVKIQDGKLVITPKLLSDYVPHERTSPTLQTAHRNCLHSFPSICQGRPVISGRLTTKLNGFYFRYGRIEIRAKFPIGDWLYPMLILEPITGFDKNRHGQMRVGFASGNRNLSTNIGRIDASTLYGGLVLDRYNIHKHASSKQFDTLLGDQFHTYSLIWQPDHLVMQVDGEEYGRISSPIAKDTGNGFIQQPFNEQYYLTIGLGAGGFAMFPANTSPATPWGYRNPKAVNDFYENRANWHSTWTSPNLEVDYVRIYAI